MSINTNDYVIAESKGTKPFMLQVTANHGKVFTGFVEQNRHRDPREIEVSSKDMVLNLGPDPKPGKVYGIDVGHRYRKSFTHPGWGSIHFYTKLDPATIKLFRNSLDRTYKIVKKHRLDGYIDKIETEVREKKGKYAGMYIHSKENLSTIWYAPECAQGSADIMDYVVLHEFGHALRYHGMTSMKLRSAWLKLYQRSIAPVVVSEKQTGAIWKTMLDSLKADGEIGFIEALKAAASEDEETEAQVKVIVRWFKQVQHLAPKDLGVLWAAGETDHIRSLWPKAAIDSSKLEPLITEYATKNVEETIAESFAYHMLGKKLPKSAAALMEKSLSYARRAGGDTEE